MKKFCFLIAALLSCGSLFAQSFVGNTTLVVNNGDRINVLGSGENYSLCNSTTGVCPQYYYFYQILGIDNSKNTFSSPGVSNPSQYINVNLKSWTAFNTLTKAATILDILFTNTSAYPITVTFQVSAAWIKTIPNTEGASSSYSDDIPYKVQINPTGYVGGPGPATGPPIQSLFAGAWASLPSAYNNYIFDYTYGDVYYDLNNGRSTKISMSSAPLMNAGSSVYSPDGKTRLTAQTDGNVVIYHKNADGSETPLWGSHSLASSPSALYFQTDVNLVLYNTSNVSLWGSNTYNAAGSYLNLSNTGNNYPFYALQNDGNLVLYWPAVDKYNQQCFIIFGASDTGGFVHSAHVGNLNHPVTNPLNTSYGSNLTNYGNTFKAGTAN